MTAFLGLQKTDLRCDSDYNVLPAPRFVERSARAQLPDSSAVVHTGNIYEGAMRAEL